MSSTNKNVKVSTFGSQITSIISVSLVLVILGILAMTLEASHSMSRDIRSNIGFVVKLAPGTPEADINRVKETIARTEGVASYIFSSPESILAEETAQMGEDLSGLLEENPFGAEFDIKVTDTYASSDSIATLTAIIGQDNAIEEVVTETAVVDSVNSVINRLSIVLLCIAAALLIISFVLINNTVSLAVYSRRFIIHTMKLVGATGGFIRRPFVNAGLATGAISAVVAIAILAAIRSYGASLDPMLAQFLDWYALWRIFAGVFVAGLIICGIASVIATNRYLRADYDDMFK